MKKEVERELKELLSLSSSIDEILADLNKVKPSVDTIVITWQLSDGRRYSNYLGSEATANMLIDLTKHHIIADRELPGGED